MTRNPGSACAAEVLRLLLVGSGRAELRGTFDHLRDTVSAHGNGRFADFLADDHLLIALERQRRASFLQLLTLLDKLFRHDQAGDPLGLLERAKVLDLLARRAEGLG